MAKVMFSVPRGRTKKIEFTPEKIEEVQTLIDAGMTQKQIYEYYKISHQTWHNHVNKNEALERVIRQGRMRRTPIVASHLFGLCLQGNVAAIIFYLRTQGGWKNAKNVPPNFERKKLDEKMVVTVTCPIEAAKIYEEFMLKT